MTLRDELRACGYDGNPDDFRDLLAETFSTLCPSWTDEELMCNPRDAIHFCDAIRTRTVPGIPDRVILRALTNGRKAGTRP